MPKAKKTEDENIRLAEFFLANGGDRKLTHHHFRALGVSKRRINLVLARVEKGQDLHYNKKSGPKPTASSEKNIKKAVRLFTKTPGLSVRDAAKKMNISHGSMNTIRRKAGIQSKVKRKVPKMTEKQIEIAKKNCAKLYKKCVPSGGNFFFVIDDETYMELDPSVPQCRPIERFWALCKSEMVKRDKVTFDPVLFKRRWTAVSKQVAEKSGKSLFTKFKAKLRLAAKAGPWSVCLQSM